MNVAIDIGIVLQLLGVSGIAWLITSVIGVNSKLAKIETWIKAHDKQDDERYVFILKQLETLSKAISKEGDS